MKTYIPESAKRLAAILNRYRHNRFNPLVLDKPVAIGLEIDCCGTICTEEKKVTRCHLFRGTVECTFEDSTVGFLHSTVHDGKDAPEETWRCEELTKAVAVQKAKETIDGYECYFNATKDESFLKENGFRRLTGVKDCIPDGPDGWEPETELEKVTGRPVETNTSSDQYFVAERDGYEYYILIHYGQWYAGYDTVRTTAEDNRKPTKPKKMKENQKLWDDINAMADAVAEAAGQNLPYCPSIDFSVLPSVIAMTFTEEQLKANGIDIDEHTLEDLRFLAENGNLLPESLKDATEGKFREYITENRVRLFTEIRDTCEGHYKEFTGTPYYIEDPEYTAANIATFLNTVLSDEQEDSEEYFTDPVRLELIPIGCDSRTIIIGTRHEANRYFPAIAIRPKGRCWVQETAYGQPTSEQIEVVTDDDWYNPSFYDSDEYDLHGEGYAYSEKNARLLAALLRQCERDIRRKEGNG